ncbi:PH domain-containing protein [Streptomyces sp. NRRL F-5126]|uniref:PH domain-containing protein n=1 Tax=Streptomyces sp. NRRL F-5126 TaxID=1463857 RepID=UPI000B169545|nr:PH domain-containing protein [Streptomyces sp. NRRL F-5126]
MLQQTGIKIFCWTLGGTVVAAGLGFLFALSSRTEVGAAGITIRRGFGHGRTYPWREIRWIEVRESRGQQGSALAVRITLANGRRRILPAIHRSRLYPGPHFELHYAKVVGWWRAKTEPAARIQPPPR